MEAWQLVNGQVIVTHANSVMQAKSMMMLNWFWTTEFKMGLTWWCLVMMQHRQMQERGRWKKQNLPLWVDLWGLWKISIWCEMLCTGFEVTVSDVCSGAIALFLQLFTGWENPLLQKKLFPLFQASESIHCHWSFFVILIKINWNIHVSILFCCNATSHTEMVEFVFLKNMKGKVFMVLFDT